MSNITIQEPENKKQKIKYKDGSNENGDEKFINLPYNKKNILITEKDIENLLLQYGIRAKVTDIEVFRDALTHKSYIEKDFEFTQEMLDECDDYPDSIPLRKNSYESLEFYGDSVADTIVRKYLHDRYPYENEGTMTILKTYLVDTKSFSSLTRASGLVPYIIVSKQVENMDNGLGRSSEEFRNILEDVFEAFIGAMSIALVDLDEFEMRTESLDEFIEFKQTHMPPCKKFIVSLLESKVDFSELFCRDTNFKNLLQQYYHKMAWGTPDYIVESHSGPAHKRVFKMCVLSKDGEKIGFGTGRKKKDGEQLAAKQALIKFGEIDENEDDDVIDLTASLFI